MKINKHEIKKILEIAIPSMIAWIGHMGYGVADNFMVGDILGSKALAVSGIATSFFYMIVLFGVGATSIVIALVAEGSASNPNSISRIMQNSIIFALSMGVIIAILLFLVADFAVPIINSQHEISPDIASYIKILAPAPIFVILFTTFEKFTEGLNRAKYSMYTVLICNIINIVLNYSFLTGSYGLPNLGVLGTAMGTLIVTICEFLLILFFCLKDKTTKSGLRFKKEYTSFKEIKKIAKLAIPIGLFSVLEMGVFSVGGFFASKISVYDVAAHQVIIMIVNVFLIPPIPLAIAVTARIAYNNADGKGDVAKNIAFYSSFVMIAYSVIALSLICLFKQQIASVMLKGDADDLKTILLIVEVLSLLFFLEVFDALQMLSSGILRGYKDTNSPFVFSIFSYIVVSMPLSFYFCNIKGMGVYGVWLGIEIGMIIQCVLTFTKLFFIFKGSKKLKNSQ
jgi:MATE family multidrug resistance protein